MVSDPDAGALRYISSDTRFFPTLVGVFLLGVLLLFYGTLNPKMQEVLIPSLVVYTMGSALIAYVQTVLFVRVNLPYEHKGPERQPIPLNAFIFIIVLHFVWFVIFLSYNLVRGGL